MDETRERLARVIEESTREWMGMGSGVATTRIVDAILAELRRMGRVDPESVARLRDFVNEYDRMPGPFLVPESTQDATLDWRSRMREYRAALTDADLGKSDEGR